MVVLWICSSHIISGECRYNDHPLGLQWIVKHLLFYGFNIYSLLDTNEMWKLWLCTLGDIYSNAEVRANVYAENQYAYYRTFAE